MIQFTKYVPMRTMATLSGK